jgi:hypothetical protein
MGHVISEILPLAIGVANIFAHLDALSGVLHLLLTRVLVVGSITLELVVLNTVWPRTELTMSSPDQLPTSLGAEKGM